MSKPKRRSKHVWLLITSDKGNTIRVKGDPNMAQETIDAFKEVADALAEQFGSQAVKGKLGGVEL